MDSDRLLNPQRLEQRESLFERIALRSLADQTDPEFKLILLSSAAMPQPYKTRLTQLCADMLGERAHIIFEEPRRAAEAINEYRHRTFGAKGGHVIQSILDDDDGVATNFVTRIKAEARGALETFTQHQNYTFISHAKGVNLNLKKSGRAEITHRNMPCTTQGLTLVAPARSNRSPFNVAHKKILNRRPLRLMAGGPVMYVRTVHNLNDSRAMIGNDTVATDVLQKITDRALPLLAQFAPAAPALERAAA